MHASSKLTHTGPQQTGASPPGQLAPAQATLRPIRLTTEEGLICRIRYRIQEQRPRLLELRERLLVLQSRLARRLP